MTRAATAPALAALWLLAAATLAAPAEGAALGILVMADRAGQEKALGPALDAIAAQLRRHGHRVETADGPVPRDVADAIARARARAGAPLDVIAVITAASLTRERTYTRHITVSLSAAVHGVTAGRTLDSLAAAARTRRLADVCRGPCAEHHRAALAEAGARELAPRLAERIAALGVVPARLIRLEGLAAPVRSEVVTYLRRLPGTRAVAAPVTTAAGTRLRYAGTLGPGALRRAISRALAHADIAATVAIAGPLVTITEGPRPEGAAAGWRNW